MGQCGSTDTTDVTNAGKRIALMPEEQHDMLTSQKILMLGAGETGKSTLMRQWKLWQWQITGPSHDHALRDEKKSDGLSVATTTTTTTMTTTTTTAVTAYDASTALDRSPTKRGGHKQTAGETRAIITALHQNALECILALVSAVTPRTELSAFSTTIDSLKESLVQTTNLSPALAASCTLLWKCPVIQTTYTRRANLKFWLLDNCEYYLNNLVRFSAEEFMPTGDDILRARVRTMGIVESPPMEYILDADQKRDLFEHEPKPTTHINTFETPDPIGFLSDASAGAGIASASLSPHFASEAVAKVGPAPPTTARTSPSTISDAPILLPSPKRFSSALASSHCPKSIKFVLLDVGGQQNERKKWMNCFAGGTISAIMFVVNLNSYNQVMFESSEENRMMDSLAILGKMANAPAFRHTPFILVFTKNDILRQEIALPEMSIAKHKLFADYHGSPTHYPSVLRHIQGLFSKQLHPEQQHSTYAVCAVETSETCAMFRQIRRDIVKCNLVGMVDSLAAFQQL